MELRNESSRCPSARGTQGYLEEKMPQRPVHYSTLAAMIPLWILSFVFLISDVYYDSAEAQDNPKKHKTAVAVACGKELKKNVQRCASARKQHASSASKRTKKNFRQGAQHWRTMLCMCDRDAAQRCESVVAGQGNILGCLTVARRSVSAQCNAALDAVFPH